MIKGVDIKDNYFITKLELSKKILYLIIRISPFLYYNENKKEDLKYELYR
jgi:hypothetical protein